MTTETATTDTTDTLTLEQAQALPLSPALQAAAAAGTGMHPRHVVDADLEWLRALGANPDNVMRGYCLHQAVDSAEVAILACRAGDRRADPLARLAGRLVGRSVKLRQALTQREESEAEALAIRLLLSGAEDRLLARGQELTAVQERLATVQERLDEAVQDRDLHREQALDLRALAASRKSSIDVLQATVDRLRPLAAAEQRRQDAIAKKRSRAAKVAAKKRGRAVAAKKKARLEQRHQDLLAQASTELAEGRIHAAIHGALARRLGVTRSWVPIWADQANAAPREEYQSGRHTTPAGKTVHHPNAYGYRTVYHCAVREIHVGKSWLKRNLRSLCREAAAHR